MNGAHILAVDTGRIIKVNHAGEHGAVNIYAGQIAAARLRARELLPELAEFKAHEERHRSTSAILREEQYHHDQSAAHIRHTGVFDRMIGSVISAATESVIWIGMRI